MARLLPSFAASLFMVAFVAGMAASTASAQGPLFPPGPPAGPPDRDVPPQVIESNVTGNTPSIAEQVDEMHRRINGEREQIRNPGRRADRARPATIADVVAGAAVSDTAGVQLGTIESVDAGGAVILTAAGRARIPLNAFGKNRHGLLLQTSKAQFEATVAHANAGPS